MPFQSFVLRWAPEQGSWRSAEGQLVVVEVELEVHGVVVESLDLESDAEPRQSLVLEQLLPAVIVEQSLRHSARSGAVRTTSWERSLHRTVEALHSSLDCRR